MKYILLLLFLLPGLAFAQEQDPVVNTHCELTPSTLPAAIMPSPVNLTNNLRRRVGSPELATGMPIYIQGTVRDEMCVPIADVKVELWHPDDNGYYTISKYADDVDPNFVGSGTAVTDNMGHYSFITILPGIPDGGNQPIAHLRISHPDFSILETDMYFGEVNPAARYTSHLSDKTIELLTATAAPIDLSAPDAGNVYEFHITLDGTSPTRKF